MPHEREIYVSAGVLEAKNPEGDGRCYTLHTSTYFDLLLPDQEIPTKAPLQEPRLHAERTIIGHGQERGGMRVILRNPSTTSAVSFVYFESLPWYMRPYLHTLQATVTGKGGSPRPVVISEIIKDIFYRPAVDRKRGTQLELVVHVPADSTVTLIYDIEKSILRYTEYPPDANRGFNVAPAVIRLLNATAQYSLPPLYLRTTSLLLRLPTPDFSMPYNVIILTSTVMALAFGSIFNILVRRFVPADDPILKNYTLKAKLVRRLGAIRDRFIGKKTKVE